MIVEISSKLLPLHGFGSSLQGGRPENQDDWGFVDTPLGFLLVVCDGMGGGPGGKTASAIVKREILTTIMSASPQTPRTEALKIAVSKAEDVLEYKMAEVPELQGMGSTLVAVLINQQSAVVAHLGDSRFYRISGNKVAFRTGDHSLVGELVRTKALTEEQARVSPQSNVITRGLGNTSNHVADITEITYNKGDRFVLCTDGVWGIMPHEQLVKRFSSLQDIHSLVSNLSQEIDQIGFSEKGNHDNHTLCVVEMQSNSILKDKMNKVLQTCLGAVGLLLLISIIFNIVSFSKISEMPKIEALKNEIADLKERSKMVQQMKDGDTKDYITRIQDLEYEKEVLLSAQEQLISKIDSLEKVIAELHKAVAQQTTAKVKTRTPQEVASSIITLFTKMETVKGKDRQESMKKRTEYRQQIVSELTILNKKTDGKYKTTITGINNVLKGDPTNKQIQNFKAKIQNIKNNLPK